MNANEPVREETFDASAKAGSMRMRYRFTSLATSMDQSFVRMRTGGTGKLSPPIPGYRDTLDPAAIAMIDSMREAASAIAALRAAASGANGA